MNTPRKEPEPRAFIRHTLDVPLEVTVSPTSKWRDRGINVSFGGLSFEADECLDEGQIIHLRVPTVEPPFEAQGRVVWCRSENGRFVVGVQFLDSQAAFQSRMVEQVCAIESYRKEVEAREGRKLNGQEPAAEWIKKFAGRFPTAQEG